MNRTIERNSKEDNVSQLYLQNHKLKKDSGERLLGVLATQSKSGLHLISRDRLHPLARSALQIIVKEIQTPKHTHTHTKKPQECNFVQPNKL